LLLSETLPRLRLSEAGAAAPDVAFAQPVEAIWLEIGFGGGEHSLAQVAQNPSIGLIGAEVFENGLCSLLSRLVAEGAESTGAVPNNLRLWDADVRPLLRRLPAGSLARVFLLFPDPWPKLRHAKRRFVQAAQIALLARALRPGGEWRIASDDPIYQEWVDARLAEAPEFRCDFRVGARPAGWPPTRYEAKALRAGRSPVYWSFARMG
jgi:tRNA (guanine-N7-)-methyltransferase